VSKKHEQQNHCLNLNAVKRRYDGDYAETLVDNAEQYLKAMEQSMLATKPVAIVPGNTQQASSIQQVVTQKPLDCIIKGPLQICIGLVGMLTASLAIFTFKQAKQDALVQQSKYVFSESFKSVIKGIKDCLKSPYVLACTVVKRLITKH
jgi:threonine dehydrogenase-like Zn-dependent dehydrogenase